MNDVELTHENIVRALCYIDDREFSFARKYMENAGFDLRRNGAHAREWCRQQAEHGDPAAQFSIAKLYFVGLWGEVNQNEAVRWCQKSEAAGFLPAKLMLSGFYEGGAGGLAPDLQRAMSLRREAADQGDVGAMQAMATDLIFGVFGQSDRVSAIDWLRRAAETGDAKSQCFLALELFKNQDSVSIAEGMKWINAAAEKNYPGAHYHLGHYFWQGSNGFPLDKSKADYHLGMASMLEEEKCASLI